MLNNFICGGNFVFNSSFDSGNLHKVEHVKSPVDFYDKIQNVIQSSATSQQPQNVSSSTSCASESGGNGTQTGSLGSAKAETRKIDAEFNLWTKPDCYGTPFENGNRTWFFFSIRGGDKNQNVKLNVMNLNKQAKLFSQGMHPVVRHGLYGKWERMKERPSFYVTEENFILSFVHRTYENAEDNLTFYAFTFPYTYTEQLEALENYDKKYEKTEEELDIVVRELNGSKKDRLVINMSQDLRVNDFDESKEIFHLTEDANDEVPIISQPNPLHLLNPQLAALASKEMDENTSESMQQLSNLVNSVQIEKNPTSIPDPFMAYIAQDVRSKLEEFKDEIYYYRELLISSYENRRVDLVTITSFHGIEEKREERLVNLFPDQSKPRAHSFKDKKVIFISSRVHPGETPASFVLNGFLNLILDRKNQIAAILRKMYVFKIVPFLNPDGVYNGLYRSDTLGHNLNRVYLNPRLDTQPTIYAVRKLIRYYHYGHDKPDNVDEVGQPINEDLIFNRCQEDDASTLVEDTCEVPDFIDQFDKRCYSFDDEENEKLPTTIDEDIKNAEMMNDDDITDELSSQTLTLPNLTADSNNANVNQEIKVLLQPKRAQSLPLNSNKNNNEAVRRKIHSNSVDKPKENGAATVKMIASTSTSVTKEKKSAPKNGNKLNQSTNIRHHHHHYKHFISHVNNDKQQKTANQQYFNSTQSQSVNISMDYRIKTDENGEKSVAEESSNLFLYLDLHGHASKKGVFMYGNHLPNTLEAVEVMLLPKLMSLNCHHFAFDACNFSERNMYLKGKRDGLSKEGSGRVAVYKSTGLIKSYTLESNYNTSKAVNILPPKGKEISCKVHNLIPPKFTPLIFEEVGRALGPSLLDLTNSNPKSRIQNSEYRSMQGLRNAMRNEINRGLSKARVSKFTKQNKKRQTTSSLPSTTLALETSKENKLTTATSISCNSAKLPSGKLNSNGKNSLSGSTVLGKIQAFAKKDVNVMNPSKKKKVLCEASTSMSSGGSSGAGVNVNQIPRKKIKVSNNPNGNSNPSAQATTADYYMTTSKAIDDEMPCCSKSIPAFLSKSPTSPASSTSSTSSTGQMKITSFMPIKKLAKTKKLKAVAQFQAAKNRIGGKLKKIKVDEPQCSSAPLSLESLAAQTSISMSPPSLSPSSKLLSKKKKLKPLKSLKKRSQKPLLH